MRLIGFLPAHPPAPGCRWAVAASVGALALGTIGCGSEAVEPVETAAPAVTTTAPGIHQSSLPLNSVSASAPGNALVVGSPLEVRSDEWLRWSPDVITEWSVDGWAERRSLLETPVSDSGLTVLLDWVLDTETRIAGLLPLDQAFALG